MDFIEVEIINWSKYNPRSTIKMPRWFALSNGLFEDADFCEFSHTDIVTWVYILCQASKRNSSVIRLHFRHASKFASINRSCLESALSKLQKLKCIHVRDHDMNTNVPAVITTRQDKTLQDTTKTECRSGDRRHLFMEVWNEKIKSLPKVKVWTDVRDRAAKRLDPADWPTICEKVEASDFLSGRSGRWTSCSIDWALNSKNATKILEGTYDNREANVLKIDVGDILRGGK